MNPLSGPSRKLRRLVIIGGGIGGTTVAKRLANHPGFEITLLDRQNHYQFQPLLFQVATAALGSPDIATPIRFMLRHAKNVRVLQAEVTGIDVDSRTVATSLGPVGYDVLLVAAGVEASYFGRPEWEPKAPSLKTLADAALIRERVLEAYEYAEAIENPAEHARQLTFVVVGGGPTGVELAGALSELAHDALAHDFRRINPREARVILVEAGPRLVPMFDPSLSASATQELRKRRVEVRLNFKVTDITERGVYLGEEFVPTANVIWAAGVRSSPLSQQLPAEFDSIGRVQVAADCSLPGHPDVFVIGDQAHYRPPGKADALPAVGGVALQQGNHVARLLRDELAGRPRKPFRYFDRGQMATITRHHAIVEVRKFRLAGFIAWWMWLAVHVVFLAGFRNRLAVVGHWAWTYLTLQRGSRLIVRSGRNPPKAAL
ncbi:MAG: NAD(P)/FAD-dependent oxidoreductase [Gammaproteobacteria bacterium]|nr:NAD(P)/FAD-dependent oxidoreductase [Gammaproteobacteria bacterium]MDH5175125.1 NAD(P)/FAD-dependent oxidoreductase [Gammaproteobacteria bacterium]